MTKHALLAALLLIATLAPAQPANVSTAPILGFSADGAVKEHALEGQFDGKLNRDHLRDWLKRLSARPHHIGSPYDKENTELLVSLFKSWGYDTRVEEFDVLFPTPKTRVVEMIAPDKYTLKLAEPPLAQDSTSGQTSEQLPTYNAYSIDGDVTGDLVYVNYGVPADYDELAKRGIDVKGKVVISRYGGSWRGIKPKVAAEHGAVGCLIYSDPHDDGYFQGDVYPKGAYRSDTGVQRGSVMDMPVHPGDPLTPGYGATKDAKRIDRKDSDVITKIPVLPISYSDALPLLRSMAGPMAPPEWRGALPIPYHLGAGPTRVHMKLEFNWNMVTIRDVIATLKGTERPDEWVLHGNHYDGWVNGASDPLSGLVAELEEARAVGELAQSGWRPKRTIMYAAWDGEEAGLLGSTEWAETHADELRRNMGFLEAGGSHSLERLVTQAARDVTDPERNVSVLERLRAHQTVSAHTAEERKEVREHQLIRLEALGSGSDYTPFLQHTGIASLNIGFGGESGGGSYHSIYDSFDNFTRFIDPNFDYGVTQAKTTGRLMLRLTNADVLPIEFSSFSDTLSRYTNELTKLADTLRTETEERNREIRDRTMELAADPNRTFVVPPAQEAVPYLNFAPLQNALDRLQHSAREYDRAAAAMTPDTPNAAARTAAVDHILMHAEQALTTTQGLPRRPWFRHAIYAPGFYTGYGVKTVPGVREAIEQRNWKEVAQQMEVVASAVNAYAAEVDRATEAARGKSE